MPARRGLLLAGLAAPLASRASPPGPVTLVVGAHPGSGADTWARSFAPFLERHWPGSSVDVVNHPGARGLAAARLLAAAPPEARLLGAVATPHLLAAAIAANEAALLDRLLFVAAVAEEAVVLVAHPGVATDLAALHALPPPFRIADPGKRDAARAIIGTPPPGTPGHLAALALGVLAPLSPLAFPSAAAARQAVLAGNIACAMLALPDAVAALRDGRLVALGVAAATRSTLLPDAPTFAAQGIPLALAAHRGFAVSSRITPAKLQPLVAALRGAALDPEFGSQADAAGLVPCLLDAPMWQPILGRSHVTLAELWANTPWTQNEK